MGSSRIVRILITTGTTVLCLLAIAAAIYAGAHILKDTSSSIDKEREKIEAEYTELGENTTDEETGKQILTKNFLMKEYKSFYAGRKGGAKAFKAIFILFLIVFIAIGVITSVSEVIRSIMKGQSMKLRSIISVGVLVAVLISGMVIFSKVGSMAMIPKPEEVELKVYAITVNGKHENTTRDSDGDEHTTYYIELPSGNHKVTSSIYDAVDKNGGYYYLVQYEGNGKVGDLAIYSEKEYVREGS